MISVCTPTRDNVTAGFTYDLVSLLRENPTDIWSVSQGTLLCNLRTLLVKMALKSGATHILFIDSDMRFPSNTISRLVARNVPVVGANCKQRTQDEWTARKDGRFISSEDRTDSHEVDTIGMGVTLIQAEVFANMPEPWFATPWDGTKHIGEDVYFCEMVRRAGHKIYVDHDLSQNIKHAGTVEFGV